MALTFGVAREADAAAIAALRTEAAEELTRRHGKGHWSGAATERGAVRGIRESLVLLGREGKAIVAVLRLATRKPWAIDPTYFTPVRRPLHLVDMAVAPSFQGRGVGRQLIEEARRRALEFPADAIRLDAYDSPAGAGGFYAKCGFTEVGRKAYRGVPLIYFELVLATADRPASSRPAGRASKRTTP